MDNKKKGGTVICLIILQRLSHELTHDAVPAFTGMKLGFEMVEKGVTNLLVNGE